MGGWAGEVGIEQMTRIFLVGFEDDRTSLIERHLLVFFSLMNLPYFLRSHEPKFF